MPPSPPLPLLPLELGHPLFRLLRPTRPAFPHLPVRARSASRFAGRGRPASGRRLLRMWPTLAIPARAASTSRREIPTVHACLERIRKHNSDINAFTAFLDAHECRAAPRSAVGKRPLDGLPLAVKDNLCTRSLPTSCASNMLRGFVSPFDATAVRLLTDAGAVVVGKTNMDEFGMGSANVYSAYGPAFNPWPLLQGRGFEAVRGLRRVAGGSSGGSAAAVAAELISKHDPLDSTSLSEELRAARPKTDTPAKEGDLSGMRIGIPQEYLVTELSPSVLRAWRDCVGRLRKAGAQVVRVSCPHTRHALGAYYVIAMGEASSNLSRYDGVRYGYRSDKPSDKGRMYAETRFEGFGPEVRRRILLGTYVLSKGAYEGYFVQAQRVRRLVQRDFDRVFVRPSLVSAPPSLTLAAGAVKVDALVTPVTTGTAPTLRDAMPAEYNDEESMGKQQDQSFVDAYVNDVMTIPASLAGIPAISVPYGTSSTDGYPIGLQVLAQHGDERTLLQVARAVERAGKEQSLVDRCSL